MSNRYTVEFVDLDHQGNGVGTAPDGIRVFCPDALPGETLEVEETERKKQYATARPLRRLVTSPERIAPPCPVFKAYSAPDESPGCGGCQIQHLSEAGQLTWKRSQIRESLVRIGHLDPELVDRLLGPVHRTQNNFAYRAKAQYPAGRDPLTLAFYARGSHELVPHDTCLIQPPEINRLREQVQAWLRAESITAYDEATHTGELRHVVIRLGEATGELMLILVAADSSRLKSYDWSALQSTFQIQSVWLNRNTHPGNRILGREWQHLAGSEVIHETIDDLTFAISPGAFFQVNPPETHALYDTVLRFSQVQPNDVVYDLYCGSGTISAYLARTARRVYGIEVVPQAIEDAKRNAEANNLSDRLHFTVGTVEKQLPLLIAQHEQPDLVVVDPPRKGLDASVIETILQAQPERFVYVSCNPATLARDLKQFVQGGYQLTELQGFDMFPQTTHVECVVLMSRARS